MAPYYTPSTPSEYSPSTPSSRAANTEYTLSTPSSSFAASPDYTPSTPSDYTPATPSSCADSTPGYIAETPVKSRHFAAGLHHGDPVEPRRFHARARLHPLHAALIIAAGLGSGVSHVSVPEERPRRASAGSVLPAASSVSFPTPTDAVFMGMPDHSLHYAKNTHKFL